METNFVVGVTIAKSLKKNYIFMDVGKRSLFSINWTYIKEVACDSTLLATRSLLFTTALFRTTITAWK